MANVSDLVFRFYGTVSYSDNTHGSFDASIARDFLAEPFRVESRLNYSELSSDRSTDLDSLLALLPGMVDTFAPAPSTLLNKEVTDVIFSMHGLVSFDDNTSSSFAIEFFNGVADFIPANTDAVWNAMISTTANRAKVRSVLEALAGTGNVTIS